MLQDFIDSISDILGGLGDTISGDEIDAFIDSLSEQGIDLSNYTPEEIQYALDVALDSDYTPEVFEGLDNQYNIAFGAQEATLQRSGGGLGSLDVTITKEPGSSNLYCISDGTHTIHNVKGGTHSIRIDGIKYILPKLKG